MHRSSLRTGVPLSLQGCIGIRGLRLHWLLILTCGRRSHPIARVGVPHWHLPCRADRGMSLYRDAEASPDSFGLPSIRMIGGGGGDFIALLTLAAPLRPVVDTGGLHWIRRQAYAICMSLLEQQSNNIIEKSQGSSSFSAPIDTMPVSGQLT